jgi:hypothetical protein
MKKLLVASIAIVTALAAAILVGTAPTAVPSTNARQHAQTTAAHLALVKYMSLHAPMMRATGAQSTLATSNAVSEFFSVNWSGFADAQNTTGTGPGTAPISSVSGSWTIPRVNCLSDQYRDQDVAVVEWVGLDGWNDDTVEQLGTATQCFEGVEYYSEWAEMYPSPTTLDVGTTACANYNTDCPQPGDKIQASVVSTPGTGGNNDYTLKLTDLSDSAQNFSVPATCPANVCLNSSAEWIVERPGTDSPFGIQTLPQPDYGQTAFANGTVGSGRTSTTIENYPGAVYDVAMVDDTDSYVLSCPGQNGPPGQLLLVPSGCPLARVSRGDFSVTWDGSF